MAICRCIEFPYLDQAVFLETDSNSLGTIKCCVSFYTLPPRSTSKLKKMLPAPQHKPIAFPNMNIFFLKKIQFRPPCTGFRIRIQAHGPLCIWIRNTTFCLRKLALIFYFVKHFQYILCSIWIHSVSGSCGSGSGSTIRY
jgi:hypothetical protein